MAYFPALFALAGIGLLLSGAPLSTPLLLFAVSSGFGAYLFVLTKEYGVVCLYVLLTYANVYGAVYHLPGMLTLFGCS